MGERRDWHLGSGSMGRMENEEDRCEGMGKRDRRLGGGAAGLAADSAYSEPMQHVPSARKGHF